MKPPPQSISLPRLPGLPVLGNLVDFRRGFLDLIQRVAELGPAAQFRAGTRPITLLNASEFAHGVLVEQADAFEKSPRSLAALSPVLGNGLLTSLNAPHKRQRKLVAPAFQHRRITAYANVMAEYAEQSQRQLQDGAELDVTREMMSLTLRIVGKTLFDADVLHEAEELGRALTTVQQWSTSQFAAFFPIPLSWPTPGNRRFRAALARLDATVYRIIADRRSSGEDRGDLLSMLLRAQDQDDRTFMTDQQVRDEAMTLFLAGHETTANLLAWTWYLLVQHPEVYAGLRAEAQAVLAGRTPRCEDLPNLPRSLQVLKEALRLYPPAYAFGRQAVRTVDVGGHRVAAGEIVLLSPYTLQHRPDYFADPTRFNPDRWTLDREASLPRFAYMPFGGGPRVCIGNHFALMEAQIILATFVQRLTFELVQREVIVPEPMITLRPKQPIVVRVRRLEG